MSRNSVELLGGELVLSRHRHLLLIELCCHVKKQPKKSNNGDEAELYHNLCL